MKDGGEGAAEEGSRPLKVLQQGLQKGSLDLRARSPGAGDAREARPSGPGPFT